MQKKVVVIVRLCTFAPIIFFQQFDIGPAHCLQKSFDHSLLLFLLSKMMLQNPGGTRKHKYVTIKTPEHYMSTPTLDIRIINLTTKSLKPARTSPTNALLQNTDFSHKRSWISRNLTKWSISAHEGSLIPQ